MPDINALIDAAEDLAMTKDMLTSDAVVRNHVGAHRVISTAAKTVGKEVIEVRFVSYGMAGGANTDVVTIDRQTARNLAVALIDALADGSA